MKAMGRDESPKQVANVAHLPGIVKDSLAMPDMHWGYGFPDRRRRRFRHARRAHLPRRRRLRHQLRLPPLTTHLRLRGDPAADAGPGRRPCSSMSLPASARTGAAEALRSEGERRVLTEGARWAVEHGYGTQDDLEHTEEAGCLAGADPEEVSDRAMERGQEQLGTLGSGNHFLEIEVVEEIFDPEAAAAFGLEKGQIAVMHPQRLPGPRVPGLRRLPGADGQARRQDRDRASRPAARLRLSQSDRGQDYLAAMACAANYAWANRQMLMHWTREAFEKALGMGPGSWACGSSTMSATTSPRSRHFRRRQRDDRSASTGRGRPAPSRRAPAAARSLPEDRASPC